MHQVGEIMNEIVSVLDRLANGEPFNSVIDESGITARVRELQKQLAATPAEIAVFASEGIVRSVAIKGIPMSVSCEVLDYDDAENDGDTVEDVDFERDKLGMTRDEWDKDASYVW